MTKPIDSWIPVSIRIEGFFERLVPRGSLIESNQPFIEIDYENPAHIGPIATPVVDIKRSNTWDI